MEHMKKMLGQDVKRCETRLECEKHYYNYMKHHETFCLNQRCILLPKFNVGNNSQYFIDKPNTIIKDVPK